MKKEKRYNKIKSIFNKNSSKKLTKREIKKIENQKGDGEPYLKMLEDEYKKMTKEEKEQVDNIMKELYEKIGYDDEK